KAQEHFDLTVLQVRKGNGFDVAQDCGALSIFHAPKLTFGKVVNDVAAVRYVKGDFHFVRRNLDVPRFNEISAHGCPHGAEADGAYRAGCIDGTLMNPSHHGKKQQDGAGQDDGRQDQSHDVVLKHH